LLQAIEPPSRNRDLRPPRRQRERRRLADARRGARDEADFPLQLLVRTHGAPYLPTARPRRKWRRRHFLAVCASTNVEISPSADGSNVVSIVAYSLGSPVFAGWKRWFRPGSSLVVTCGLAFLIAAKFSSGGTCRSF